MKRYAKKKKTELLKQLNLLIRADVVQNDDVSLLLANEVRPL